MVHEKLEPARDPLGPGRDLEKKGEGGLGGTELTRKRGWRGGWRRKNEERDGGQGGERDGKQQGQAMGKMSFGRRGGLPFTGAPIIFSSSVILSWGAIEL